MKTISIALASALFGALLAFVLPRLTGDWPFGSPRMGISNVPSVPGLFA